MGVPIEFDPNRSIHNDKYARLLEAQADRTSFLRSGKTPQVGQRTEIRLALNITKPGANMKECLCRISGVITNVGDWMTSDLWKGTSSNLLMERYHKAAGGAAGSPPLSRKMSERILKCIRDRYGTVHGQCVTTYGILSPDRWSLSQQSLPIPRKGLFKIVLQAQEHRSCVWKVVQVVDVTLDNHRHLPIKFCNWLRCQTWWMEDDDDDNSNSDGSNNSGDFHRDEIMSN
jgi:hypothetical protein